MLFLFRILQGLPITLKIEHKFPALAHPLYTSSYSTGLFTDYNPAKLALQLFLNNPEHIPTSRPLSLLSYQECSSLSTLAKQAFSCHSDFSLMSPTLRCLSSPNQLPSHTYHNNLVRSLHSKFLFLMFLLISLLYGLPNQSVTSNRAEILIILLTMKNDPWHIDRKYPY